MTLRPQRGAGVLWSTDRWPCTTSLFLARIGHANGLVAPPRRPPPPQRSLPAAPQRAALCGAARLALVLDRRFRTG
jgi:hypothetical protein